MPPNVDLGAGLLWKEWGGGTKRKRKDGNVIRTRRLIAFAASPAVNLMHSDLFPFILLISALLLLSQMWACAQAAPSRWDSGGNKADGRPDYSSLHWLCPIPPASLQPKPQQSEPCNRLARSLTTVRPPERSSVRINTRHNTVQE